MIGCDVAGSGIGWSTMSPVVAVQLLLGAAVVVGGGIEGGIGGGDPQGVAVGMVVAAAVVSCNGVVAVADMRPFVKLLN